MSPIRSTAKVLKPVHKEPTRSEINEPAKLDCSFLAIVVSLMYTGFWQPHFSGLPALSE